MTHSFPTRRSSDLVKTSTINVTKSDGLTTYVPGSTKNITYTIQVYNSGPSDIEPGSISIIDFFDSQYTSVNWDYYPLRSEEHTSQLQSLMRISYAFFCLKKKHTQRILQ